MSLKAKGNAVKVTGLGFGKQKDMASQNFIGGERWMQHIERGTLKINPELATMSLDDILTSGGLNFGVLKSQTFYKSAVSGLEIPSRGYSVYRTDTDVELGHGFSDGYQPISYPDILSQFFQNALDLGNIPTRAISFDNGAKGAIQFAMPQEYLIADRPHKTFLNFYSSHDGTYGVTMNECDICILCGNTFAYSFRDTSAKWTVKHTVNMQSKINDIREKILISTESQQGYYFNLDKMAAKKVSFQDKNNFLMAMFPDGDIKESGKVNQGPANQRIQLDDAISTTVNERNSADTTFYDLLQGAFRQQSYKTQNRGGDAQFGYVMKSIVNQNAYDYVTEAMK